MLREIAITLVILTYAHGNVWIILELMLLAIYVMAMMTVMTHPTKILQIQIAQYHLRVYPITKKSRQRVNAMVLWIVEMLQMKIIVQAFPLL